MPIKSATVIDDGTMEALHLQNLETANKRKRFMVESVLVLRGEHHAQRFTIEDGDYNRPINLIWADRADAVRYADRLNQRSGVRRPLVPLGVW